MRSIRSYQREIALLKQLVRDMQWVQPSYNGSPSCSSCSAQQHWGCYHDCPAAKVTGDRGRVEEPQTLDEEGISG